MTPATDVPHAMQHPHWATVPRGDLSTEDGRASQRNRQIAWSVLASALGRGLGMVSMVLAVSWTMPYLGAERFGIWSTIASFTLMLAVLDFGAGHALTNQVAREAARHDPAALRQAISGGLGLLAAIGLLMATVLAALGAALPWEWLIKSSGPALADEVRRAAVCFGVLFGLSLFGTGVQRVFSGLQRSYEAHAAAAVGALATLAALWECSRQQAGVPTLVLATLGIQVLTTLPLLFVLLRRGQLAWLDMRRHTWDLAKRLLPSGSAFFVLQLGVTVGWAADSLIAANMLGAEPAAVYGITQRLMQCVAIPLSLLSWPLWAAYADAHARGDHGFIRTTLRRSLLTSLVLAVAGVTLVALLAEPLTGRWTQGHIAVNHALLLAMAVWTVLETCTATLSMALNGCGVMRPQLVSVALFIGLALPLKFLLAQQAGLSGIVWAAVVSQLVAVPLLYATVYRQQLAVLLRGRPLGST